jgi:hypothetical protein
VGSGPFGRPRDGGKKITFGVLNTRLKPLKRRFSIPGTQRPVDRSERENT